MSLGDAPYKLAMHLIGVHCNTAAIDEHDWEELNDQHDHEHFGPGGIRGHLYTDWKADPRKIEEVLEEVELELDDIRRKQAEDSASA
jgi:hypothetical protein